MRPLAVFARPPISSVLGSSYFNVIPPQPTGTPDTVPLRTQEKAEANGAGLKTLVSPTHALKLPAGRLPPVTLNGAPAPSVLSVSNAASCLGVAAHIVSEQVIAIDGSSK